MLDGYVREKAPHERGDGRGQRRSTYQRLSGTRISPSQSAIIPRSPMAIWTALLAAAILAFITSCMVPFKAAKTTDTEIRPMKIAFSKVSYSYQLNLFGRSPLYGLSIVSLRRCSLMQDFVCGTLIGQFSPEITHLPNYIGHQTVGFPFP